LPIVTVPMELDAIRYAISIAPEGSLIVHLSDNIKASISYVKKLQHEEELESEYIFDSVHQNGWSKNPHHQFQSTVD